MYDWNFAKHRDNTDSVPPHPNLPARHTDCGLGLFDSGELDNSGTLGTGAVVEDLGLLNITSGFKQLDEIVIKGGPRKLLSSLE